MIRCRISFLLHSVNLTLHPAHNHLSVFTLIVRQSISPSVFHFSLKTYSFYTSFHPLYAGSLRTALFRTGLGPGLTPHLLFYLVFYAYATVLRTSPVCRL